MTARALCLLAAAAAVAAGVGAGCGPRRLPRKEPPKKAEQNDGPTGVVSRGVTIVWQKTGAGRLAHRMLTVDAETGSLDAVKQSGTLRKARGVLYREDRPGATFDAPVVEASRSQERIVARGGVTLRSVQPPGAVVTARRMTWLPERNLVVAEGDVLIVYRPPNAAQPAGRGGPFPRIRFDTQVNEFRFP